MKFQVFKNGEITGDFELQGAYLFGSDGIAVRRAQIKYKKGIIECSKTNLETAGLSLLWPVDGFEDMLLPTTCLPERQQPYNLNLEIARAVLMRITDKREDWSLFDIVKELTDISNQARDLFIEAVQNISTPAQASVLADESIKKAVILSEKLAANHAQKLFDAKIKSHGFSRGCLGCMIEPSQLDKQDYLDNLFELFGFVTIPVSWAAIEPEKGGYDFLEIDKCINALGKKKLAICAGPLLCFSKDRLPGWLLKGKVGFETIREAAYQFILKLVGRYTDSIFIWRVVKGLNVFNHFGFGFEQVLEMTRAATMAVKAAGGRAGKIVEISQPWGEYYATESNTIPPLIYADMVVQSGINFDAFGLDLRPGPGQWPVHSRNMMQISSILDCFGVFAKPLCLTGVEVPAGQGGNSADDKNSGKTADNQAGQYQGRWVEQFYKIALSKSFVDTVTYAGLTDAKTCILQGSGLMTAEFEPKESFRQLKKFRDTIFTR